MQFCGLDVGTTGVKAVVFDATGTIIASEYRAYDMTFKSDGTRSMSPAAMWTQTKAVLHSVAQQTKGDIEAICVSSFGEAFVAVDRQGNDLCEVMIYTDRRGEAEYFAAMEHTSDREIAQICGLPPSPTYSLSKILYLKENEPETFQKTYKFLLIEDYIGYRLSGLCFADYSVATRTMLFDIHKRDWSDPLLERFGLNRSLFAQPVISGSIVGELLDSVSDELGLHRGVKLVAGGHDQTMNALGAGAGERVAVCSLGTSGCSTPVYKGALSPEVILSTNLCCENVWADDLFCTLAYNPSAGLLVQWFFSVFAADHDAPPYALFEQNLPASPNKILIQPYLMGSGPIYMDHLDRFALIGADVGSTRYDIYQSVLDALAFDQRLSFEALRANGLDLSGLICVGGGSASVPWLQTMADILQTPVSTLTCKEAGALGCAISCAVALGVFSDHAQAQAAMSHVRSTLQPSVAYKDFYDEKFLMHRKLHEQAKELCAYICT